MNGEIMLSDDYLEEAASKFAKFHSIKYEHLGVPLKPRHDRLSEDMRENYFGKNVFGKRLWCFVDPEAF